MKLPSARTSRAPETAEQRKARAGELGARRQVENAQRRAELPVRPRLEIEPRRLAPGAHDPVGGGVAVGDVVGREVGYRECLLLERGFDVPQPHVERLHLLARGLEPGHQLVGGLLRALPAGDFLGRRVALGLERLHSAQELAPLAVELEDPVEQRTQGGVAATQQRGAAPVGVLAQALEIDHGNSVFGEAGNQVLEAAIQVGQPLEGDGAVLEAQNLELAIEGDAERGAHDPGAHDEAIAYRDRHG